MFTHLFLCRFTIIQNPIQPGPINFLDTKENVGIFGVLLCRTFHSKSIFLIDEAFDTDKGANAVISMLHYYLENHGLNATVLHFNADNCTGQNKNNTLIQVNLVEIYIPLLFFIP